MATCYSRRKGLACAFTGLLTLCAAAFSFGAPGMAPAAAGVPASTVWLQDARTFTACEDINSATAAALQRVRGIGPAKSRAAVAYREQHGPFASLEGLARVRGIGPATVENFRKAGFCVRDSATEGAFAAPFGNDSNRTPGDARLECIDVNAAGSRQLQAVSGIGPSKARAVIAFREQFGPFASLDELERVRGIGPVILENFRRADFCVGEGGAESSAAIRARPVPYGVSDRLAPPYDRALYGGWRDDDGDCQNTRQEVLIAESLVEVALDATGCRVIAGMWLDPYTGFTFTDPGDLDVDHFIPLAEAHRSGAATWDSARRRAFANNLRQPAALIAVSARANRSKRDRDPAGWLPPNEAYHCRYVEDWVAQKAAWQLSMDASERRAVSELLGDCSSDAVMPLSSAPGEENTSLATDPVPCADINAADAEKLRSIDGMTRKAVNLLLYHIRYNGPIESLSDVTAVRGIGPAVLDNLRSAGFCEAVGRAR